MHPPVVSDNDATLIKKRGGGGKERKNFGTLVRIYCELVGKMKGSTERRG